jgi:hypothetical protein
MFLVHTVFAQKNMQGALFHKANLDKMYFSFIVSKKCLRRNAKEWGFFGENSGFD